MVITDEITRLVGKLLEKKLGKEEYEKRIRAIADILNDFEYHDVVFPAETLSGLVLECLTKQSRRFYRSVWSKERAMNKDYEWRHRAGKWMWKSTTEKLNLLSRIRDMRQKKVTWKEISKELQIDANAFVYNIQRGLVYATEKERELAKEIQMRSYNTSNKLAILSQIKTLRDQNATWKQIDKQLNLNAYLFIRHIIRKEVRASAKELALAKRI